MNPARIERVRLLRVRRRCDPVLRLNKAIALCRLGSATAYAVRSDSPPPRRSAIRTTTYPAMLATMARGRTGREERLAQRGEPLSFGARRIGLSAAAASLCTRLSRGVGGGLTGNDAIHALAVRLLGLKPQRELLACLTFPPGVVCRGFILGVLLPAPFPRKGPPGSSAGRSPPSCTSFPAWLPGL
jgi:hypothetical protein